MKTIGIIGLVLLIFIVDILLIKDPTDKNWEECMQYADLYAFDPNDDKTYFMQQCMKGLE